MHWPVTGVMPCSVLILDQQDLRVHAFPSFSVLLLEVTVVFCWLGRNSVAWRWGWCSEGPLSFVLLVISLCPSFFCPLVFSSFVFGSFVLADFWSMSSSLLLWFFFLGHIGLGFIGCSPSWFLPM